MDKEEIKWRETEAGNKYFICLWPKKWEKPPEVVRAVHWKFLEKQIDKTCFEICRENVKT